MTPTDKRFYTFTLRLSEEAVVASRDQDTGDITEQDLKDVGEMVTDFVKDMSESYVDTVATIVGVTGPTRDRGGDIPGVTGPMHTVSQLNKLLKVKAEEFQELRDELDKVLSTVLANAPKCWDGDESAEGIVASYVNALEDAAIGAPHTLPCNGGC